MLNKGFFKRSVNTLEGGKPDNDRLAASKKPVHESCPNCRKMLAPGTLEENLGVCTRCGFHSRLGVRRRLTMICDEGTFQEWDADMLATDFLRFPGYEKKLEESRGKSGENDAVLTGCGKINGLSCALFIMNPDFMMGSMGAVVGEKITRLFERALEEDLAVVGFTVSGGARMQEGMVSLMQMAKTSAAVERHSAAGGLYIAVLTDPTSGGVTASFAMEADILLAEPGALIAFAGPRVIEQAIHKKLPQGFQRAEFLLQHGFLDKIVPRNRLRSCLYRLLRYHGKGEA